MLGFQYTSNFLISHATTTDIHGKTKICHIFSIESFLWYCIENVFEIQKATMKIPSLETPLLHIDQDGKEKACHGMILA